MLNKNPFLKISLIAALAAGIFLGAWPYSVEAQNLAPNPGLVEQGFSEQMLGSAAATQSVLRRAGQLNDNLVTARRDYEAAGKALDKAIADKTVAETNYTKTKGAYDKMKASAGANPDPATKTKLTELENQLGREKTDLDTKVAEQSKAAGNFKSAAEADTAAQTALGQYAGQPQNAEVLNKYGFNAGDAIKNPTGDFSARVLAKGDDVLNQAVGQTVGKGMVTPQQAGQIVAGVNGGNADGLAKGFAAAAGNSGSGAGTGGPGGSGANTGGPGAGGPGTGGDSSGATLAGMLDRGVQDLTSLMNGVAPLALGLAQLQAAKNSSDSGGSSSPVGSSSGSSSPSSTSPYTSALGNKTSSTGSNTGSALASNPSGSTTTGSAKGTTANPVSLTVAMVNSKLGDVTNASLMTAAKAGCGVFVSSDPKVGDLQKDLVKVAKFTPKKKEAGGISVSPVKKGTGTSAPTTALTVHPGSVDKNRPALGRSKFLE